MVLSEFVAIFARWRETKCMANSFNSLISVALVFAVHMAKELKTGKARF